MGMFRIFISPTVDESGQPLPFEEMRRLMIELDKFSMPCKLVPISILFVTPDLSRM